MFELADLFAFLHTIDLTTVKLVINEALRIVVVREREQARASAIASGKPELGCP
jgi:hypothetical protein